VRIDALCLDCGEPLEAAIRDGVVERLEPGGICGYTNLPFREWRRNWPDA
jgi:hypothetical protein